MGPRNILTTWGLVAALMGCAPHSTLRSQSAQREPGIGAGAACLPTFPDEEGWFGGDAAYSVPLPTNGGRDTLWLFGDSFVARSSDSKGRQYPFVHNSIGLSTCDSNGHFQIDFHWHRDGSQPPRAFFVPPAAPESVGPPAYYWPFDGFLVDDVLYVGLLRVVESPPRGPFGLPFRTVGMDLARISNYREATADWEVSIRRLSTHSEVFPGSAFIVRDEHLYAFAFMDRGDGRSPRMLARLPLDRLRRWGDGHDALEPAWETWTEAHEWQPGLVASEAALLMEDDATEMSVEYRAARGVWIAVYNDPKKRSGQADAGSVSFRSARRLEGPWSKPRSLFSIPEVASADADPNVFCYASKSHPQFASVGEITVTYVCNLFARTPAETGAILDRLTKEPALYRARAVRRPLPLPSDRMQ